MDSKDQIDPVAVLSGKLFEINKYFETQINIRDAKCHGLQLENLQLKEELKCMKLKEQELKDYVSKLEENARELELANKKLRPLKLDKEANKVNINRLPLKPKQKIDEDAQTQKQKGSKRIHTDESKHVPSKKQDTTMYPVPERQNAKIKTDPNKKRKMTDLMENIFGDTSSLENFEQIKHKVQPEVPQQFPSNVTSLILKYIPLKFLRKFREVSKEFNSLVIKEFNRREPRLAEEWNSVNKIYFPFIQLTSDKDVESFLNTFTSQNEYQFPYKYFKIYPNKICLKNLTMFLSKFGVHIVNLYWKQCGDRSLKNLLYFCPNIAKLWIEGINASASPEALDLPRLKELTIFEPTGNKIISHKILKRTCSKNIKVFSLYLDDITKNILTLPFTLSKLTLGFNEDSFWNQISIFLESQASSLTELKLSMCSPDRKATGSKAFIKFPILNNLETLDMDISQNTSKLKPIINQLPKLKNLNMKIMDEENLDFLLGSNFSSVSNLNLKIKTQNPVDKEIKWNKIFSTSQLKSVLLNTSCRKPLKDFISAGLKLEKFHLMYNLNEEQVDSDTNYLISLLTGYAPGSWKHFIREKYREDDFNGNEAFLLKTKGDRICVSLFEFKALKNLTIELIRRKRGMEELAVTNLEQGVIEHSFCRFNRLRKLELKNISINHTTLSLLKQSHDVVRVTPQF